EVSEQTDGEEDRLKDAPYGPLTSGEGMKDKDNDRSSVEQRKPFVGRGPESHPDRPEHLRRFCLRLEIRHCHRKWLALSDFPTGEYLICAWSNERLFKRPNIADLIWRNDAAIDGDITGIACNAVRGRVPATRDRKLLAALKNDGRTTFAFD